MTIKLSERIANELEEKLAQEPDFIFPSISRLSEQHNVSYRTMWNAVKILAHKKLVVCRKGKKIDRADGPAPHRHFFAGDSSTGHLYSTLRNGVLSGKYPSGEPMPKFDYLESSERISRMTVAQVFRVLAHENLVHKSGKKWLSGPPPLVQRVPETADDLRPAIILLTRSEYTAYVLYNYVTFASFVNSFGNELFKNGMQLITVQMEKHLPPRSLLPGGINDARSLIRRLGERYRGAIIVDLEPDMSMLRPWIWELSCVGKTPVIFFDYANTRPQCTREALSAPLFYRLYFNEPEAVQAAVEYLARAGHTTIGFPTLGEKGQPWTLRRQQTAHEAAQRLSPPAKIVTAAQNEPFWDLLTEGDLEKVSFFYGRLVDYVDREHTVTNKASILQNRILEHTPSMVSLIRQGATAIISMNDRMARQHYLWLSAAGFDVPRHMSIISFDNAPEAALVPITTLDFGFGRLGYLAAHILINDIRVQCDKNGNIPGICTIIERGSVAQPAVGAVAGLAQGLKDF
jgi:DNA-binding LacI/PurR family transcriptional regulator